MLSKSKCVAKVVSASKLAENVFELWLETNLAKSAKAGCFIALFPNNASTLLPRPISICEVNDENTAIRVVYRVVGKGTAEFSSYKVGDYVNILGVLGNGYPLEEAEGKRVFLMGGGIGIPPILELAKEMKNCEKIIILGYRDAQMFLKDELEKYGTVYVATEDGSVGIQGNVMNVIEEEKLNADIIYACGPMPMLRAIKRYAMENGIKAYLSLEERMACGVGACLGCVCKTTKKDHHSHVNNARICTDGPVFLADDVVILPEDMEG